MRVAGPGSLGDRSPPVGSRREALIWVPKKAKCEINAEYFVENSGFSEYSSRAYMDSKPIFCKHTIKKNYEDSLGGLNTIPHIHPV